MIYYSAKRKGFFDLKYGYENLPDDLVSVTEQQHKDLLQANWDGLELCVVDGVVIAREYQYTQEELAKKIVDKRNMLLRESDWTQNADVPEATKSRYVSYRQKLRDITDQPEFPVNVVWPEIE